MGKQDEIMSVVLLLVLGATMASEHEGDDLVSEQMVCEGEGTPGWKIGPEMPAWRSQGGLRGERWNKGQKLQ